MKPARALTLTLFLTIAIITILDLIFKQSAIRVEYYTDAPAIERLESELDISFPQNVQKGKLFAYKFFSDSLLSASIEVPSENVELIINNVNLSEKYLATSNISTGKYTALEIKLR